jgi:ectoine hydroxylase-related dioxygenase (phytanoyl-CoA dioxygenase family)
MGNDFPDPHAVFVAITPCNHINGCLQVVPGSHLLGPMPHTPPGADSGLEENAWNQVISKGYSPLNIELDPGDGVFFHGNTIHLSGINDSNSPRIGYLVTLNTRRSSPLQSENHCNHPTYSRMHRFYGTIESSEQSTRSDPFFESD